jgi:hypothetical protein
MSIEIYMVISVQLLYHAPANASFSGIAGSFLPKSLYLCTAPCSFCGMSEGIDHLVRQSAWCRTLGSPITADILLALADVLDGSTETGRRVIGWIGNADDDALSMRIAGGVHALARRRVDDGLSAYYRGDGGDSAAILKRIVPEYDAMLSRWLDRPPQTNEVMRSAVLWPGLMEIARCFGPRMEWLELGSSAGLNLNMDRFDYDLGGVRCGDAASPVKIKPEWKGEPPFVTEIDVVSRKGVDRDLIDLTDPAEVERLTSFVWAQMPERMARIEGAIAIVADHQPLVEQGDLVEWLEAELAKPQSDGLTRVIFHSITFQYIPQSARDRVEALLQAAGAKATPAKPLARLQMEMVEFGKPIHLSLQCWPGNGAIETLALVHPHGSTISWVGGAS